MLDYVLPPVAKFFSLWCIAISMLLIFAPDARFSSPQWQFIHDAPGGPASMGVALLVAAVALGISAWRWRPTFVYVLSYIIGTMFGALAFTMGAAALGADHGGVMGFPVFGFVAAIFLIFGSVVSRG